MARAGNRGLRPLLGRLLPTSVVGILTIVLVVGASVSPGYPAADLDLHDGSVWVTNRDERLLGKLNKQIPDLETSVLMVNPDFDVIQDKKVVLAVDRTTNQVQRVDPTTTTLGTPVSLPGNNQLVLGEQTLAVVDRTSGRMWAQPVDQVLGVDFSKAKADWELGRGGVAAVSHDGTPVAISVERSEIIRTVEGEPVGEPLPFDLDADADVRLAVVADTAVVLDRTGNRVWVEGTAEPITDDLLASAQLQASSATVLRTADHDFAGVLSTATGLYGVSGDELVHITQGREIAGTAIQPVVVEGCVYGAFSTGLSGKVATVCSHTEPNIQDIPSFDGGELVFRVNRDVVVLNDQVSGNVWMVTEAMQLVRDWTKVTPPTPEQGESTDNNDTVTRTDPKRTEENQPPTAVDDEFGVRAGRSTTIPVIENDSDPDGDILTVVDAPEISQGSLELVRGGTGLQVTLPASASGTISFTYTIEDGRGGRDSANVRLMVRSADQQVDNQPPQMKPSVDPLAITLGSTAQRRVLLDWYDPDGDDLILISAEAPGDDEVTFTPDGMLTYTDVGTTEGRKVVDIVVSDGVAETAGQLVVNASKRGNIPPLANGDYYMVSVGEELTARPLANDVGNELSLVSVGVETPGPVVTPNYDDNTFSFRADRAGTYYVGYIVSNGPQAFGIVRVDVVEATSENRPPVATRDVALLPAGGAVLVDPLANDEDLDNDVLVLQNVSTHPDLKVRMIQRQLLEITAANTPSGPITLTYTVSDGHESVPGTLVVVPAPPVGNSRPVAVRDEVTVRAGDTTSVRVLANDSSPAGLRLTVDAELPEEPMAGHAWVDGEYVRFAAPPQDGEYRLVYQIRDELDQTASAQIRIFVVSDEVENTPPTPRQVEGRVLAGTTSKVLIPLEGIDPEGDAVRLIGIDSSPKLGRVTAVDEQWLEYEAYPESGGTDSFTYAVTDSRGATAVGQIRIGVVPRSAVNSPPTTVDDPVSARPGREVRVPVLANDTDPDGDAFGFTGENALQFDDIQVETIDQDVQFVVPGQPGNYLGAYNVIDVRGAEATGYVLISADPSAPLMAPVARDDQVSSATVANKQVVEVPVMDNDYDPDGPDTELSVRVPDYGAEEGTGATVVGRNVRVVVSDTMQQIRYELVDGDGLVDSAVITVPGNADAVPALREDVTPQQVVAGEPLILPVNDFVIGTRGRQVHLTGENRIWGSNGDVTANSNTELTFVAPVTYVGPAAAIFEVTDSSDADTARTAVVTIPIEVLPPPEEDRRDPQDPNEEPEEINRPPVSEPMTLTIGAGEGPKSLDVSRGVTDPDEDQLTFSDLTGETASGTRVTVQGSVITAEAEITVPPGTTMEYRGTVSDGRGGEADIVVTINVTASSKPNPRAVDDTVADAIQGEPAQVAVLGNDFNPFESEGMPLRVVSATTESGTAAVAFDDGSVTVTPGESFVGEAVVRYQVEDATGAADRRSEARIRLTVVGTPDAPGVARMIEVGDRQTTLQWTAPAANGKDIQHYTVTGTGADGSSVSQQCPSTSCTITGLTNNVEYTFRVTATNEVGESDPSGVSAAVRPDVRPETPAAPTVQWGDQSVSVSWTAPENNGSPLTEYTLQMRGPNGIESRVLSPSTTSLVWENLQNGSAYAFQVQASNSAPEPSNFSAWSADAVPAGQPDAPTAVSAKASDTTDAFGTSINVEWGEVTGAAANGDAVTTYTIYRNGSQLTTVGGGVTSYMDSGLSLGTAYRYTVAATNKAGQGNQSSQTEAITPYVAPTISAPSATAGDRRVAASWNASPAAGGNVTYYAKVTGGTELATNSTSHTFTGLTGGTSYRVELRACTAGAGGQKCSQTAQSSAVTPWAPPSPPQLSVRKSGQKAVVFEWSGQTSNNNGANAVVELNRGSGWVQVGASGSETKGNDWDQSFTYKARMKNTHGQYSSEVTRTGSTDPKPPRTVTMSKGARRNLDTCTSQYCHYVVYNLSNFFDQAGGSVMCQLTSNSGYGFQQQRVNIGSNGSGRQEGLQVYGAAPSENGWVQATCDGVASPRFNW